jgi:hypothetical protein
MGGNLISELMNGKGALVSGRKSSADVLEGWAGQLMFEKGGQVS